MASETSDIGVYLHLSYQGKIYYLSDAARTTSVTYFPFLANSPTITYGGDGFARVKTGSISILRYVEDFPNIHIEDHPFTGNRYFDLLTSVQEIPFELFLGDRYIPLFTGTLALDSVTENTLEFSVMEEEFEEQLVFPVLDKERSLTDDIFFVDDGTDYKVIVSMSDNPFTTDDVIIFERKNPSTVLESDSLIHSKINDNRYIVTDRTIFYFYLLDKENPDTYIKLEDLGLDQSDIVLHSSHGFSSITGNVYKLSSSSAQTYYVGKPVFNPFSYGQIEIKSPLIHAGSTDYSQSVNYYLVRNPAIDTAATYNLFDDGIDISSNIVLGQSNADYIALSQTPVGELAISGISSNGIYLNDFYRMVCRFLNGSELGRIAADSDMPYLDNEPDFALAPDASTQMVPIFKDAEVSVIELASEVSKAANYQFFFRRYRHGNGEIRRKMVVIDTNAAFSRNDLHNSTQSPLLGGTILLDELAESFQIKTNLNYPFPIKALQSTININRLYQATAESVRDQSIMKTQDLTFRVKIHSIGNTETETVYANNIDDGVKWLERKALTRILPTAQVLIRDIREDLELGNKLRVFDEIREVMLDMLIQEIGYDFVQRRTTIQGITNIGKIERY